MKMFNIIGIGECAGSGISDIYQVWEDEGWVTPKVEEQYNPDRTILTLSLAKTGGKVVEKWRKKVAKKSGEKSDEKNRHIC